MDLINNSFLNKKKPDNGSDVFLPSKILIKDIRKRDANVLKKPNPPFFLYEKFLHPTTISLSVVLYL